MSTLNPTTIPTRDLYNYLPHKPPMVWIDDVLFFSENEGRARTQIKADGLYNTDGKLRASSFIEFTAQAYAFVNLAYRRAMGERDSVHEKTYLAAVKDFQFHSTQDIRVGDVIETHVQKTRNFGPITVVKGACYLNETLIASCELKLFSE